MEISRTKLQQLLDKNDNRILFPLAQYDLSQHLPNFFPLDFQPEINILAVFYANTLKEGYKQFCLSFQKLTEMLNIGRKILSEGNLKHMEGISQPPGIKSLLYLLKDLLQESSFNYLQLTQVTEYFTQGYFKHFNLFRSAFQKQQQKQVRYYEITVDQPLESKPLAFAVQRLNIDEFPEDVPLSYMSMSVNKLARKTSQVSSKGELSKMSSRRMKDIKTSSKKKDLFEIAIEKTQEALEKKLGESQRLIEDSLESLKKKLNK